MSIIGNEIMAVFWHNKSWYTVTFLHIFLVGNKKKIFEKVGHSVYSWSVVTCGFMFIFIEKYLRCFDIMSKIIYWVLHFLHFRILRARFPFTIGMVWRNQRSQIHYTFIFCATRPCIAVSIMSTLPVLQTSFNILKKKKLKRYYLTYRWLHYRRHGLLTFRNATGSEYHNSIGFTVAVVRGGQVGVTS